MRKSDKEKQFIQLFHENKDMIYRLCLGYLRDKNEVEDLFQDVMMNVWRGLESFRGDAKVSTWIYRIAVNTSLMYIKKEKRKKEHIETTDMYLSMHHSFEDTDYRDELTILRNCIAELKKQDRLIISLFLEGMSYEEISDIIGISVNYVGVKINRIRKQLQKMINHENNR